ncbi:efflux RND transporter periplasmic adaptor subunit [Atrimonas thermophila]|uniref:efflux RND transporter periplasmic adaptor subunit n=1 Tax=Atrimonas thermophila TaxID=3064161 RepID=UPI00399D1E34
MSKKVKVPIIITVIILAILLITFRFLKDKESPEVVSQELPTVKVERGSIEEVVSELGTLEPWDEIELTPETGGEVAQILVEVGQRVKKGDPLLVFDTSDLEISLKKAQAQYKAAQAELEKALKKPEEVELKQAEAAYQQALVAYEEAKDTYEKNQKLFDTGAISLETLKESERNLRLAEANLEVAKAELADIREGTSPEDIAILQSQLEQIQTDIEVIEKDIQDATVVAPIESTILSIEIEEGERATDETVLMVLGNVSLMRAVTYINEVDIPKVKIGQKVRISVDAFPDQTFWGEVTEIGLNGVVQENVVTYPVKIKIPNPEGLLFSGMTVEADIIIEAHQDTLLLPTEAVEERDGEYLVFVMGEDGKPQPRKVKVGLQNESRVEIVEGLQEGDEVLLGVSGMVSPSAGGERPRMFIGGPPPGR